MNKVFDRQIVHVYSGQYQGQRVIGASVHRTMKGWNAVLLAEGLDPVTDKGHPTAADAEKRLFDMLDQCVPDFLSDGSGVKEKTKPKSASKAKAVVTVTSISGRTPRHHGRIYYVITGQTEGQIKYAARRLLSDYRGYGILFQDLETIDGVLTMRGSRSDNCE